MMCCSEMCGSSRKILELQAVNMSSVEAQLRAELNALKSQLQAYQVTEGGPWSVGKGERKSFHHVSSMFLIKKCIKAGSYDHRGHLMPLDATDLPGCKDSVESDELGFLKRLGFEDTWYS